MSEPRDVLIRHAGRRRVQGGAVSIGRAGRGRTECRHWSEGGRWICLRNAGWLPIVCIARSQWNSPTRRERCRRKSCTSSLGSARTRPRQPRRPIDRGRTCITRPHPHRLQQHGHSTHHRQCPWQERSGPSRRGQWSASRAKPLQRRPRRAVLVAARHGIFTLTEPMCTFQHRRSSASERGPNQGRWTT